MGGKETILPGPKPYWLHSQSSRSGLAHHSFLSLCFWESENAPKKQDSSSQQLETAGSHKCLSVIYQLLALLNIIQNYSVSDPTVFVDDPALFQSFSQNKAFRGSDALKENWIKYFIPSSMCFVRGDRRFSLPSAEVSNCK